MIRSSVSAIFRHPVSLKVGLALYAVPSEELLMASPDLQDVWFGPPI
jgi:hypothetical protein